MIGIEEGRLAETRVILSFHLTHTSCGGEGTCEGHRAICDINRPTLINGPRGQLAYTYIIQHIMIYHYAINYAPHYYTTGIGHEAVKLEPGMSGPPSVNFSTQNSRVHTRGRIHTQNRRLSSFLFISDTLLYTFLPLSINLISTYHQFHVDMSTPNIEIEPSPSLRAAIRAVTSEFRGVFLSNFAPPEPHNHRNDAPSGSSRSTSTTLPNDDTSDYFDGSPLTRPIRVPHNSPSSAASLPFRQRGMSLCRKASLILLGEYELDPFEPFPSPDEAAARYGQKLYDECLRDTGSQEGVVVVSDTS